MAYRFAKVGSTHVESFLIRFTSKAMPRSSCSGEILVSVRGNPSDCIFKGSICVRIRHPSFLILIYRNDFYDG